MLNEIIQQMKVDLAAHKRDKKELLETYVQKRLDDSLASYYEEIQKSLTNLLYKDSLKSMKKVLKTI